MDFCEIMSLGVERNLSMMLVKKVDFSSGVSSLRRTSLMNVWV